MESTYKLDHSLTETTTTKAKSLNLLSKTLSYIAFEAPIIRVTLELSLCFLLFETLVQLTNPALQKEHPGQWIVLWFGCCIFIAIVDVFIFVPAYRLFNLAFTYASSSKVDQALNTFDLLSPNAGRLVHLPKRLFHLERAKLLADLNKLELAESEVKKIPAVLEREISELSAEIITLSRGFDALKNLPLNEFTLAASLMERGLSENKNGIERNFIRQAKEKFSKLAVSGPDRELAQLYCDAADLWLGYAESSFPRLVDRLQPSGGSTTTQNHLGKLYLIRAFYSATHKEKELAISDYKLGSILTRPYQVKQLKEKVRQELGEFLCVTLPF